MKKKQKGLSPVAILVVILAFVGGFLLFQNQNKQVSPSSYTQSTDETANWKTYTNTKYGYSVMYPQELYLTESDTGVNFTPEPYPSQGPGPLNKIQISTKGDYLSSEFEALFKASPGDDVPEAHHAVDVKVTKIENLKFDNYDAVEFLHDGLTAPKSGLGRGPIGYSRKVLIKKSNQEFIELINTSMDVNKTKQREPVFDQILSTFTFLDQNQVSDVSNRQTYTYQGLGYSISYPVDWQLDSSNPNNLYIFSPNKAKDNQKFYVLVNVERTNKEPGEWLKGRTVGGACCPEDIRLSSPFTINGVTFHTVITNEGQYPGIIGQKDGKIYYIYTASGFLDGGVYYFDENDRVLMDNIEAFNKILSTFKFQ